MFVDVVACVAQSDVASEVVGVSCTCYIRLQCHASESRLDVAGAFARCVGVAKKSTMAIAASVLPVLQY
jgi:hypothetical protein